MFVTFLSLVDDKTDGAYGDGLLSLTYMILLQIVTATVIRSMHLKTVTINF